MGGAFQQAGGQEGGASLEGAGAPLERVLGGQLVGELRMHRQVEGARAASLPRTRPPRSGWGAGWVEEGTAYWKQAVPCTAWYPLPAAQSAERTTASVPHIAMPSWLTQSAVRRSAHTGWLRQLAAVCRTQLAGYRQRRQRQQQQPRLRQKLKWRPGKLRVGRR